MGGEVLDEAAGKRGGCGFPKRGGALFELGLWVIRVTAD